MVGGQGDDTITGGTGTNVILGDSGKIVAAAPTRDRFGTLPITLGLVADDAPGIGGDDHITTGTGSSIVFGGTGGDMIRTVARRDDGTSIDNTNFIFGDDGYITWVGTELDPDIRRRTNLDGMSTAPTPTRATSTWSPRPTRSTAATTRSRSAPARRSWSAARATTRSPAAPAPTSSSATAARSSPPRTTRDRFGDAADHASASSRRPRRAIGGNDTIATGTGSSIVFGGTGDASDDRTSTADEPAADNTNFIFGDNGYITWVGAELNPEHLDAGRRRRTPIRRHRRRRVDRSDRRRQRPDHVGSGSTIVVGGQGDDTITGGTGTNVILGDTGKICRAAADADRFGDAADHARAGRDDRAGRSAATTRSRPARAATIVFGGTGATTSRSRPAASTPRQHESSSATTATSTGSATTRPAAPAGPNEPTDLVLRTADVDRLRPTAATTRSPSAPATRSSSAARATTRSPAARHQRDPRRQRPDLRPPTTRREPLRRRCRSRSAWSRRRAPGIGGNDTITPGPAARSSSAAPGDRSRINHRDGAATDNTNFVFGDDGYITWVGAELNTASLTLDGGADSDPATSTSSPRPSGRRRRRQITIGSGSAIVVGGQGADTITGGSGTNIILGDSGQSIAAARAPTTDRFGTLPITVGLVQTTAPAIGGVDHITTGTGGSIVFGGTAGDVIKTDQNLDGTTSTSTDNTNFIFGDDGYITWVANELDPAHLGAGAERGRHLPRLRREPRPTSTQSCPPIRRTAATTRSPSARARRSSSAARATTRSPAARARNIILGDSGHDPRRLDRRAIASATLPITVGLAQTTAPTIGGVDHITTGTGDAIVFGGTRGDVIKTDQNLDGDNERVERRTRASSSVTTATSRGSAPS